MFKVYEKHLWKSSTLVKSQNSFAGIFWLFLVQLQNKFFVEHLPVVAYVRCLKEKELKKWNSVFLLYSGWHSSVALQGSVGEIRTNQKHFSLKNEKKIKNSQTQTKFAGSYKKKMYCSDCVVNGSCLIFNSISRPPGKSTSWRCRSDVFLSVATTSQEHLKQHLGWPPRHLSGTSPRRH